MSILEFRWRLGLLSVMVAGALSIQGCATTGQKVEDPPAAAQSGEAENKAQTSVEYINVVGDGDRVLIGTTGSIKYAVFKLTDPSRLVMDLPGVDVSKVTSAIDVGNGFIKDISAQSYGAGDKQIGRITVTLDDGMEHEVKSGENSILISLSKGVVEAPEGQVSSQDAPVMQTNPEQAPSQTQGAEAQAPVTAVKEDAKPGQAAPEVKETAPAKAASRLTRIESSKDGENTVIRIMADGAIGAVNAFDLDSPSRVVVDVWGVDSTLSKPAIKINDRFVKTVRVGSHPDKARLVIDSAKKALAPHSVKKEGDQVVIVFGPKVVSYLENSEPVKTAAAEQKTETPATIPAPEAAPEASKEAKAEPAPVQAEDEKPVEQQAAESQQQKAEQAPVVEEKKAEAPAPVAEEKKALAPAPVIEEGIKVEQVDFKRANGAGRLTVTTSKKAEYTITESRDGSSIIMDIKGAVISEALSRTLDATKLKTPVLSVSSYQESTSPEKDVRVLVKLKDTAKYEVKDTDGSITVDFMPAAVEKPASSAAVTQEKASASVDGEEKLDKEASLIPKKVYKGVKIDLDMVDANISDVLRLLAEVSNLNIIASDELKGTISLRLKNVPWDQAFDIILRSKDLDMLKEGNVVRVAPAARIRTEREAALASRKAQEKLEDLQTRFIAISYATADDLIPHVKAVLTDRGTVTSEKRTSTLIIRDIRKGLEAAEELIKKLDKTTPQVLIEARIVEASSSFARDLGIQWGLDYGTGGTVSTQTFGAQGTSGQSTRAQTPNSNIIIPANTTDQYAVNLPASGNAGTLGALGFLLGKAGTNPFLLDLRISAGESAGQLKTISRPRIVTIDNKEAKIEQGESIPFETTSSSGTATTFVDANLSLTVTPHITPDGSVLMKIKASRNSIGTFRTSGGAPSINKKESTTEVLVRDGETTVIGGIVISDKNENNQGIPYFKDIPILGWFFKSKSISDSQQELLIFITPTIMKEKIVG